MNKIKLKVHDWDEQSKSLIVSFTSDASDKTTDETVRLAYQPTMFGNTDKDYVMAQIAKSGASICETQHKQEQFAKDESKLQEFASLVGSEIEFEMADLFAPVETIYTLPIGSEPR
jgi:hypothetical protein